MAATAKPAAAPTALEHFDSAAASYEKLTGGSTRDVAKAISQLPQLDSAWADAIILDNACGTGIVTEEIIQHCIERGVVIPKIRAVDGAPNMVDMVRSKLAVEPLKKHSKSVQCEVTPGERLDFEDETFTISITSMGLFLFTDPAAGAKEIYRTLKPGGVAVVTTWTHLGYLDAVIRPTQRKVQPGGPVYSLPISEEWFKSSKLEECLRRDGGFSEIEMIEHTAHYGAPNAAELADLLFQAISGAWITYSEDEKAVAQKVVLDFAEQASTEYESPFGGIYVGLPMKAAIAIARK